jgi:DNA-binding transcriptional LysR family regulator
MAMDLVQLRYFLTTVECGSFARASEKLNVTQPALSKAIQRLETNLGVQLLDRLPRGVSPTAFGERLASHASLIAEEVGRARDSILALRSGASGKVTLGAGSSMRLQLLPRACAALLARCPDIELCVIGELYDHIMPDLENGKLDLGVSMIPHNTGASALVHEPLYRDQIHPTVRVGHPLLAKPNLTAADCASCGWILPAPDNPGRRRLEAFFFAQGLGAPQPSIVTNSTLFAISTMQNSDLIGWHPKQVIGDSAVTGLAALPVPEITLTRRVGLSYRRADVLSAAARLLIEELHAASARMVEDGLVMPLD